ncbi:MAG: FecR domain-containing protein [Candidatus Cloacimonetes bacterium]|nr:FecR domain-containing protein [Candidatus Cloacimonadota bacterium]
MKKKIFILILMFIFAISLIAQESVGITLKVKGDVILTHEEENFKAQNGSELVNNDVLESKTESFAVVKFIDGSSVIKLFPNSILTINAEKTNGKLNKRSTMKLGELWAKVTKNTGDFIIDTPTTVVSVKGTRFVLSVSENGFTDLYTLEGVVNIKNKKDDNEADVGAGQKAHSTGENEIILSVIEDGEMDDYDVSLTEILNINLKNDAGEKRSIKIELE